MDLERLQHPVSLEQLQTVERGIQAIRDRLEQQHGALYFPFEPPVKRHTRPTQAYITKFPAAVVRLLPALHSAATRAWELRPTATSPYPAAQATSPAELGAAYRQADEEATITAHDPFTVDPALIERGTRGHATTQNRLAAFLVTKGFAPRSPKPGEPNFDLAWVQGDAIYVAEVKRLTEQNEEKQLRLGLGQVLRLRHLLGRSSKQVRAVLVAERELSDSTWLQLCEHVGVVLVWPETLAAHL